MAKKLYILISNGGDGSYYPQYVLDFEVLNLIQEAYDQDLVDYESCPGVDGDGFHWDQINIPDDATPDSLGISVMTVEDVKDMLER
jgi:hypothetical protein